MPKQPRRDLGKLAGLHGEGSGPAKALRGKTGMRLVPDRLQIQTFQSNKTYL